MKPMNWGINTIPNRAYPHSFSNAGTGGPAGMELQPIITGVTCYYCECKLPEKSGETYLSSRGRAICKAKKCRFALSRDEKNRAP